MEDSPDFCDDDDDEVGFEDGDAEAEDGGFADDEQKLRALKAKIVVGGGWTRAEATVRATMPRAALYTDISYAVSA